ncbi:DNA-dependent RNA polymerase subunit epsilon [Fictibacillus iocasae]|uniref:DNA-directed RNA polymerase subunit epsilon n=1 Tax=Fictibacillus iocasae TaxID=2715437 RepID=A0ABW2NRP0_9BACL
MIYKVFFQIHANEVPVRENTKTIYVEAGSIAEVRNKLKDRSYNIEFIQEIKGEFLDYEQSFESYVLENV